LLELRSKDYSFVSEGLTTDIYEIFASLKLRPNLTQNAAISMLCVVDDRQGKVESLALKASELFDVNVSKDLTLLTIRHFNETLLAELIGNRKVVLKQQTPETIQVLMK
jgi:aspartate kinase